MTMNEHSSGNDWRKEVGALCLCTLGEKRTSLRITQSRLVSSRRGIATVEIALFGSFFQFEYRGERNSDSRAHNRPKPAYRRILICT